MKGVSDHYRLWDKLSTWKADVLGVILRRQYRSETKATAIGNNIALGIRKAIGEIGTLNGITGVRVLFIERISEKHTFR